MAGSRHGTFVNGDMVGKDVKLQLLHGSTIGALVKELNLYKYMCEESMRKIFGIEVFLIFFF